MEYKILGNSTLRISRIGFGCMSLKNDTGAENVIHRAIDLGINFFDTADLYDKGGNEVLVGKAIREKRKDLVLATKGGNQWREDGSGWNWNPGKLYLAEAVEKSLQRLGTDYIDLYQLHGGTISDPIDEVIETFETLVAQGKIRYYGISSIRPNVIDQWVKRSRISSVMMQYSLLDRRPEENMLTLLQQYHIGVLVRGSLSQGLLSGKPPVKYLDHSEAEVDAAANAIRNIAGGNPGNGIATSFVLQHPAVTSAVVGIRTMEQLEAAVKTMESFPLSEENYRFLQDRVPARIYTEHRIE